MQDWVRALMSILLKYQGVARLGDLGALLLDLSKGLGRLRELLADGRQTAFVAVTRPAALPRLETRATGPPPQAPAHLRHRRRGQRGRARAPVSDASASGGRRSREIAAHAPWPRGR